MITRSFESHNSFWTHLMILFVAVLLSFYTAEAKEKWTTNKKAVVASVEKHDKELTCIRDSKWNGAWLVCPRPL